MKVPVQSLGKRTIIRPNTAFAAVAASLLSLTGACGDSGSNGSGTAPFTSSAAAGAPGATAAGTLAGPATATAGSTAPVAAAGTTAPTGVGAAGSGTTTAATGAGGAVAAVPPTAAGSSAAGGGAAAPVAATFTAVLEILADSKNNCGLCHKSAMIGGGLMFDPTDKLGTFTALVGPKSPGTFGSTCGGKTYVVPGKPDDSLLYDKVSKATPVCGLRMPASGVTLDDPEIATIKAWIMAGAPNN
jgi:hypothetical protein